LKDLKIDKFSFSFALLPCCGHVCVSIKSCKWLSPKEKKKPKKKASVYYA
jgi:hypothetical protein